MTPFVIGNVQFTFSLLVYALIAMWFVHPALKNRSWSAAVTPLLLVHVFRYGPLTMLMPGQVDTSIALSVKETIAYGDLVSAIFAMIAAILCRYSMAGAKMSVWLFSVVGIVDIVLATKTGIEAGALDSYMGFNLYILNFYVPMLIVTHVVILTYLLRKPVA